MSFTPPPDYADVQTVDLDIVDAVTGVVNRTIPLGKPPVGTDGRCTASINTQPVKPFGNYYGVARCLAGGTVSDPSQPSAPWERAPGAPTNLTFP